MKMHHHIALLMLVTAGSSASASDITSGSGNTCPDGYAALGSVAACRAAMDLFGIRGEDYLGAETEADWPKGCYVCDDQTDGCENGVWFNNHETGAAVADATSLCAIEGWEAALGATKVLFVGDSDMDYWDTTGLFVEDSQNVGYGGYTCEETLAEMDEMLDMFKPEWVVTTCGENDLTDSDVASTFSFFKQIVDKVVGTGARVITLGTKPEPDTGELHEEYEEYDSVVRQLAYDMAASDAGNPPPLVMIDTYPSFVALGNPGSLYAGDGLHLANDGGYVYWEEWLTTALYDNVCVHWLSGSCAAPSVGCRDCTQGALRGLLFGQLPCC